MIVLWLKYMNVELTFDDTQSQTIKSHKKEEQKQNISPITKT